MRKIIPSMVFTEDNKERCASVEQIVQCRKSSQNRIVICACALSTTSLCACADGSCRHPGSCTHTCHSSQSGSAFLWEGLVNGVVSRPRERYAGEYAQWVSASERGWRPQSSSGARVTARPPEERVSRAVEAEQGRGEARKASGTEIEPPSSATSAWTPRETRSSASADICSGTTYR